MLLTLLLGACVIYQPEVDGVNPSDPDYAFKTVIETDVKKVTPQLGSGDFSGITYLGGKWQSPAIWHWAALRATGALRH